MEKLVKSPLNYTGGKYKLLPQIIPFFPKNINIFYDIFGGGFNVGVNVKAKKYIYNDILTPVVELIQEFHSYPLEWSLELIDGYIKEYKLSKVNKEGYLKLRAYYNENPTNFKLYTLICHSFNNQIRFNKKGEYNMPFGRRTFNDNLRKDFISFVEKLQTLDITFCNEDFREFATEIKEGDFVYVDPPYLLSTATYNESGGWSVHKEWCLHSMLDSLNKRGVKWAMSNVLESKGSRNTLLDTWLNISKYNVHKINQSYKRSNYQRKDYGPDVEILITNYD